MGLQTLRRIGEQERPSTVAAADTVRLVRQVIEEIWNDGDLELADRLFSPNYINHGGLIPDLVRGPEAIKVSVVLYRTAFPQFRLTVIDLVAEGQSVAVRWAAHTPPRRHGVGAEPDGESKGLVGMTFGRVRAGQIAESWTCWETERGEEPGVVGDIRAVARRAQ